MTRCAFRLLLLSVALFSHAAITPTSSAQAGSIGPVPQAEKSLISSKTSVPAANLRKQAAENRFISMHPILHPELENAIPGIHVLQSREARRKQALLRQNATPQTSKPSDGSSPSSTSLPGIQMRTLSPGGETPTAVVTGDFNRDGKQDYIVANGSTNDLWFYAGNGDGTFQLPRIIPLNGLAPIFILAVSLRNNGILDLVVADYDSNSIGVLFGNGDGTFGYEQSYSLPESPVAIVIADFRKTGHQDLAVSMQTTVDPMKAGGVPYLAVLPSNGDGTFGSPSFTYTNFYSYTEDLSAGDVNADGLPDLLNTGYDLDNSTIWINNGDGTFHQGQTIISDTAVSVPSGGKLVDIDGDSCLDAIVSDIAGVAWVSKGNCSGSFAPPTRVYLGDGPSAIQLADVNGDGNLDIIAPSEQVEDLSGQFSNANSLNIAFGDGKGNFTPGRTYVGPGTSFSVALADFNGDGKLDVVTADEDNDSTTVYLNDSTGGFGFPQGLIESVSSTDVISSRNTDLTFADVNHDGKPDIFYVGVDESTGTTDYATTTLLNDGTGKFNTPIITDTGISYTFPTGDYRLADFRNTGKLDVVMIGQDQAYTTSNTEIIFIPGNGDGTFGKATLTTTASADGIMTIGDFNGDGKLDFVTANGSHTLTTFFGNGDGTFRNGNSIAYADTNESVSRIFTGDFNHDGKLDVLLFSTSNGYWTSTSSIWEFDGNGDGTFQTPRQLFTDFQPMTLADINNDGSPDIVRYDSLFPGTTSTVGPATFTNYLGQTGGTFLQSSAYTPWQNHPLNANPRDFSPFVENGDPTSTSLAADYNGDGKLDELALEYIASTGQYFVQILMGNGDGTFIPTYNVYPVPEYTAEAYARPLDGTGLNNFVQEDAVTGALNFYKTGNGPTLQITLDDKVVQNNASCGTIYPDLVVTSDRTVALASTILGVNLPASVDLPANAYSARFCYTIGSNFDPAQVFDVRATLDGYTAIAYASVAYSLGYAMTLSPSTPQLFYVGEQSQPIAVTLIENSGYTSTASLSCVTQYTTDSCNFGQPSLSVGPTPSSTSLTIADASTYTPGSTTATVQAYDGKIEHRQNLALTIINLQANYLGSTTMTFNSGAGESQTLNLTVTGIPSFSFACTGLPVGATCNFSGTQNTYPNTSSITVTITTPSTIAAGTYSFQIVTTSSKQRVTTNGVLNVFDFTMQPPSTTIWSIPNNSSIFVPITVTSSITLSGYAIGLTCSLDFTATCSGNSAPVTTNGSTANLVISVPANAPLGQHQLTVVGTYGSITHTITVPFYVASYSGSLNTNAVTVKAGSSSSVTAIFTATTGFNTTISTICSTPTTYITCTFSPSSISLSSTASQTETITLQASTYADLHRMEHRGIPREIYLVLLLPFAFALRRKRLHFTLALLLTAMLPLLQSCSSASTSAGGSGGGSGGGGGGSTPNSTYTVTVDAAPPGSVYASIGTITVTVTH